MLTYVLLVVLRSMCRRAVHPYVLLVVLRMHASYAPHT